MSDRPVIILGIESSCDDTAAAVIADGVKLSNVIANQEIHKSFGGVVPELASRAHQQNIVPVVELALQKAGIKKSDLSAIAFTRGPGLLGSLLVGSSFAKAMSLALSIPLIEVNHLEAHVLAHFIKEPGENIQSPEFPFLCLTVSGGHTQLLMVKDSNNLEIIGQTKDDAAGEAFDKIAKSMGLPYPGGPMIDKYSLNGNPYAFNFPKPDMPGLDFSFSGLKTSFINFLNKNIQADPSFVETRKNDICASVQHTIIQILTDKLKKASLERGITEIAIAGGVSANSGLRRSIQLIADEKGWKVFIPKLEYCTDNAAMIAITGYFKYLNKNFADQSVAATARFR